LQSENELQCEWGFKTKGFASKQEIKQEIKKVCPHSLNFGDWQEKKTFGGHLELSGNHLDY